MDGQFFAIAVLITLSAWGVTRAAHGIKHVAVVVAHHVRPKPHPVQK